MNTRIITNIAAVAAAALLAATCIYPYKVDIERGGDNPLVVEGDIHVGGITTVKLSYVRPFNLDGYEYVAVKAKGYVEGEDGSRVTGELDPEGILTFDTSNLSDKQRYRLHFETLASDWTVSNVFESDWLSPCPAPTIDGLTYSRNQDFRELWIGLSMHCNGAHHFRWTFLENWEYHSDIRSYLEFIPRELKWDFKQGKFITVSGGNYLNTDGELYYCWKSNSSPKINIFSTVNQTEDRFEELAFHTIALNDKRLQSLYRITVQLEALSEDAYNYWYNMQQNSSGQGSIFSPVPSEMASNVYCISDPSLQVMGYLNAAVQAKAVMYYDNEKEGFYEPDRLYERFDTTISVMDTLIAESLLKSSYLPYRGLYNLPSPDPSDYTWAMDICIDCRKQGGTKDRPADWPKNGHY